MVEVTSILDPLGLGNDNTHPPHVLGRNLIVEILHPGQLNRLALSVLPHLNLGRFLLKEELFLILFLPHAILSQLFPLDVHLDLIQIMLLSHSLIVKLSSSDLVDA